MAEFPLAAHSETVSKVLSSIVPPRAYAYLSAFLPGLFFVASVYLANPQFIQRVLGSDQSAFLGKYSKTLIAIFFAYVAGHALMLWVSLVHRILGVLYRTFTFMWRQFCTWRLYPDFSKLMQNPRWNSPGSIARRIYRHAQNIVTGIDPHTEGVGRLWTRLVRYRLKGLSIDLHHLTQEELNALYEASRTSQLTDLGGHMLMLATHALGWGGLVAIRLAPALANRSYIIFCVFMIVIGLLYEWWLIRSIHDPYVTGLLKVRAALRELYRLKPADIPKRPEQDEPIV